MQKITSITYYLLGINVVCYLLQLVLEMQGINLSQIFGLHFIYAEDFKVYQLFTYMFLHSNFQHLFFNMFSFWMFASPIESSLGSKRFLTYYLVCGIGAGICQELFQLAQYYIEGLQNYTMVTDGISGIPMSTYLNMWTTIGASGACYGILLAFGRLYPNHRIMLLIPPIPMKAKYFIAGLVAIELLLAYNTNSNIAHFAHLGGMLFGWMLLSYWKRQYYQSHSYSTGWNNGSRNGIFGTKGQSLKNRMAGLFGKHNETPGNAHHTASRESDYERNMRKKAEEARMDEILDKIRISGYDSLTKEEKQELFRISRR